MAFTLVEAYLWRKSGNFCNFSGFEISDGLSRRDYLYHWVYHRSGHSKNNQERSKHWIRPRFTQGQGSTDYYSVMIRSWKVWLWSGDPCCRLLLNSSLIYVINYYWRGISQRIIFRLDTNPWFYLRCLNYWHHFLVETELVFRQVTYAFLN